MKTLLQTQDQLREAVGEILRAGKVDVFLGYEKAGVPFRTRPFFARTAEAAHELVWNSFCAGNLAVYLPATFRTPVPDGAGGQRPPRIGLLVKPCDCRCVRMLVQEGQLPRENLFLVGVNCPGMIDRRRAEAALRGQDALGAGEDGAGNIKAVQENGSEITLSREAVLADACRDCADRTARDVDLVLGEAVATSAPRAQSRVDPKSLPLEERWARFTAAIGNCIRCNACRQACPECYCRECFAEQTQPRWLGAGSHPSDLAIFHIMRAFHLVGRCTDCGACVRACPMAIDARWLIRELNRDSEQMYAYRAGECWDGKPLLTEFASDDPQDFVVEP